MESILNATISKILTTAAKRKASNIHLTVGAYPTLRISEDLIVLARYVFDRNQQYG